MKRRGKKKWPALALAAVLTFSSLSSSVVYATDTVVGIETEETLTVQADTSEETAVVGTGAETLDETQAEEEENDTAEPGVVEEEVIEENLPSEEIESEKLPEGDVSEVSETTNTVQSLIDALPSAEELKEMGTDELNAVYAEAQEVYDAYDALSEAEQSEIDIKKLEAVFEYFNSLTATLEEETSDENTLEQGVNVITTSQSGKTFNIGEDYALMIEGTDGNPIVFDNCTFNLSGTTIKISGAQAREDTGNVTYYNGEVITKLFIGKNVKFNNCTFIASNGKTQGTAGYDACIYFFSGNIVLNDCNLSATGWEGQFLGLYGSSGSVTFNDSTISTVGEVGGWSYAMYSESVLNLNGSTMTATGMLRASSGKNINAFYSGDLRTSYDAINITDSVIDFSDNQAGGFAINNVNIHVTNSEITVNNNLGNACNSGYWIVKDSSITMDGNRGGHALSCIGIEMSGSTLEILHNGYAGLYIQTKDSSFTDSTVDIRCNGEKLLSYTAGDVWLNSHTLTITNCTSNACEESAWLGAVGRKGTVKTTEGSSVVAYDLNSNSADNLKSNTTAILTNTTLALDGESDAHVLFLNPWMKTDYARGNAESANNNDADLFSDDNVSTYGSDYIIAGSTAKIGTMTTAQLSHHNYDWDKAIFVSAATETNYGVVKYECVDVCDLYESNTTDHTYSFDCAGTYVYAPLVGLSFDGNGSEEEPVSNLPDFQTQITYGTAGEEPTVKPTRESADPDSYTWLFTGWYTDEECTEAFDFSTALTANWTTVYAGWKKVVTIKGSKTWDDADNQDGKRPEAITIRLYADGTELASQTVTEANDWAWTFADMAKESADGVDIVYTITEDSITDYTSTVDGYNVTNSYTPGKTSVSVTKSWDDEGNADKIRPASVTISLLKNGASTGETLTLNASNNWTGSFTNLNEYTDGSLNTYTVTETSINGYTTNITGNASEGFVVTNTHEVTTAKEDPTNTTDTTETTGETNTSKTTAGETSDPVTVETTVTAIETSSAETGDSSNLEVFVTIMMICVMALIALVTVQYKKRIK